MPQCTRSRNMRSLRQHNSLEYILWSRAQDEETRLIAAEEAAKLLAAQAAQITNDYSFLLAEDLCFFKADGTTVQAAMAVMGEDDAVIVVCNHETGEAVWTVQMRPPATYPAAAYIQAVQARVEANRAARH